VPEPKQANDDRNLEWIHVDDFTPGCYDNSFISLAEPKLAAPLGAADAIATFCCAGLGQGLGLGPLPALTNTFLYAPSFPGTLTKFFVVGFAINPGLDSGNDEAIIILEGDDGTSHYVIAYSTIPQTGTTNTIAGPTITSGHVAGIFGAPYPAWTRINAGGTPGPPPPSPKLVFPTAVSTDARGVDGHLWVYSSVAAPSTFVADDLITGVAATPPSSVTGQVITYGDRVICLAGVNYQWPAGGGINTNENINFTDPPESAIYGNQQDVLASEEPWGYGAWGTISVGELFLIKKNGGGLIIYGDIDSITSVVSMPGVQSVGDFVGRAAPGPLGLVYCSEQRGAWTWNGSNTGQKISEQLRDAFYDATTASGMQGNNYGFDVAHWQNWILFSNNYLYDMDHGGWWQLYPGTGNGNGSIVGQTFWWWNEGRFGNQMYAAPLDFTTTNRLWYARFDEEVPAPHWQWQSLPIHVIEKADRSLDVRQVVLRLSDPSASGNATATVTINAFTETITGIPLEPTAYRLNVGVQGIQDIVIKVTGDNSVSGSSPILHSIDLGYQVRAGVPVSD
jgi:hypothetical protein